MRWRLMLLSLGVALCVLSLVLHWGVKRVVPLAFRHEQRVVLPYKSVDPEPLPNGVEYGTQRQGTLRPSRTYVMTYYYVGQQGAGVRSIASLQCFLSSFKHSYLLAEPYMENSFLRGTSAASARNVLTFGDIFDMDIFNAASRENGRVQMVPVEEFLENHPSTTILINVLLKSKVAAISHMSDPGGTCIEDRVIDRLFQNTSKVLLSIKSERVKSCFVRIVDLPVSKFRVDDSMDDVESRDVENFIFGEWSPQEVTVVFSHWAGPYHIPALNRCFREFNTTITKQLFKPSKRLLRDAEQYESMFLGGKNKLAIMLRFEKILQFYLKENHSREDPNSLSECVDAVLTISGEIEKLGGRVTPVVTMDVGAFGSGTFHSNKEIAKLSQKALSSLYHKQWSVKDWEKSFVKAVDGRTNEAYIAALQRTLASKADCLVLMGGGSFQMLAVESYLDYHENTKPCIHLACGVRKGSRMVQRLIKNPHAKK